MCTTKHDLFISIPWALDTVMTESDWLRYETSKSLSQIGYQVRFAIKQSYSCKKCRGFSNHLHHYFKSQLTAM